MMKILFLDIDGVLNNTFTLKKCSEFFRQAVENGNTVSAEEMNWPLGHLDNDLVPRLNEIVEKTDCKIVISSSWRLALSILTIREILSKKGFKYSSAIIGRTSSLNRVSFNRGYEIYEWLKATELVVKYAILDDDGEEIYYLHPKNFVATNRNKGLTQDNVDEVIDILNI